MARLTPIYGFLCSTFLVSKWMISDQILIFTEIIRRTSSILQVPTFYHVSCIRLRTMTACCISRHSAAGLLPEFGSVLCGGIAISAYGYDCAACN